MLEVALAGAGLRSKQKVAVLGDEKKDEPVPRAEELALVVLLVELAVAELREQPAVGGMREEAAVVKASRRAGIGSVNFRTHCGRP